MPLNALVFADSANSPALEALLAACRSVNLHVQQAGCPRLDDFESQLPRESALLLLPAFEEDCLGIKLAQLAQVSEAAHEVLLYSPDLPAPAYIAQALQEGVSQMLHLQGSPDALLCQLRRALGAAERRWKERAEVAQTHEKLEVLKLELDRAAARIQRLDERCAGLSRTALSLATGEMNLSKSQPTLMVVSASQARCEQVCSVAERMGFHTQRTENAAAGLKQLSEQAPDVLLCDGELSDMNATQFARKARAALGRKPITIIAWSAGPNAEERLLGQAGGVDDLVSKGSDPRSEIAAALLLGLVQSQKASSEH